MNHLLTIVMLPTYHVLIRLLGLLQGKHRLVNNGMDIMLLDLLAHLLKLHPRANVDTADDADV